MRKRYYITDISSRGQETPCEEEEMEFFTWLYKDLFRKAEEHRRAYVNGKMPSRQYITDGAENGGLYADWNSRFGRYESARVCHDPDPSDI